MGLAPGWNSDARVGVKVLETELATPSAKPCSKESAWCSGQ